MHIHSDVNERNAIPSASDFELVPLGETIDAADHNVTPTEQLRLVLPTSAKQDGLRIGKYAQVEASRNLYL
jgi:hypothetical protein